MTIADDAEFISHLYRTFLYRDADATGQAYWQEILAGQSLNRAEVTLAFINSPEFQQTVALASKLYLITLGRAPESDGLTYWTNALRQGHTAAECAAGFTSSDEFLQRFGSGLSDADFLDVLYQNAFDRAADTDGKAYWLIQMATGMSQSEVIAQFASSAEFTQLSASQVQGIASYYGILERAPDTAELAAIGDTLTLIQQLYASAEYTGAVLIDGTLVDGYIRDATVFFDSNGNALAESFEASTSSDQHGQFTLGGVGTLTATGGVDIATGQPVPGALSAPQGATVISPLTTLAQQLVAQGLSVVAAEALISERMGLDNSLSLLTLDPIASTLQNTVDLTAGLAVQGASLQLMITASHTAALLQGVAGSSVSLAQAFAASQSSLATVLQTLPAQDSSVHTAPFDLTDTQLLQSVSLGAAALLVQADTSAALAPDFSQQVQALADETATITAGANSDIGVALASGNATTALPALRSATQVQTVALDSAFEALLTGAAQGDLEAAVSDYSSGAFDSLVEQVSVDDQALAGGLSLVGITGASPADDLFS